jgi:hypothetical protein
MMAAAKPLAWLADITRNRARGRRCPGCKAWVVQVDGATLDPRALTAVGEALAMLDGRHTYEVARFTNVKRRNAYEIRHHPATTHKMPVDIYATHLCNSTPEYPTCESQLQAAYLAKDPECPPY